VSLTRRLLNQAIHASRSWVERAGAITPGAHQPVAIGSGSWIGHGAIILPGTTIGRNVVVAAGSVVRGTVEDHAVVGGVPARVLHRLEQGVGWSTPAGGDLRPVWSRAEVEAALGGTA